MQTRLLVPPVHSASSINVSISIASKPSKPTTMPYPSDHWIHMRVNNHMHRSNDVKFHNAKTTE